MKELSLPYTWNYNAFTLRSATRKNYIFQIVM